MFPGLQSVGFSYFENTPTPRDTRFNLLDVIHGLYERLHHVELECRLHLFQHFIAGVNKEYKHLQIHAPRKSQLWLLHCTFAKKSVDRCPAFIFLGDIILSL